MAFRKNLSLLLLSGSMLAAQNLPEDPVMKARTQRALAQGIREADLPQVPRSITEPPPLPPPEVHLKDTRGGRAALAKRKAKATTGKGKGAAKSAGSKVRSAAAEPGPAPTKGKAKAKPAAKPKTAAKPGKRAGKSTRKAKP